MVWAIVPTPAVPSFDHKFRVNPLRKCEHSRGNRTVYDNWSDDATAVGLYTIYYTMWVTVGWSDVTVMWSQDDIYVVRQHGVLCEVKWWNLSRYSNKIKAVGLRKCPYYHYLTTKVMSQQQKQTFLRACPHHGGKRAGIDMAWKNYITVTLCIHVSM